jgi:hypothetical protein
VTDAEQPGVQAGSTAPGGGRTVTVLTTWPPGSAGRVPVSLKVTVPPAATSTSALLTGPVPEVLAHRLPVPRAAQVHCKPDKAGTRWSSTVRRSATSGPPSVTVTVNVSGFLACACAGAAVFVTCSEISGLGVMVMVYLRVDTPATGSLTRAVNR